MFNATGLTLFMWIFLVSLSWLVSMSGFYKGTIYEWRGEGKPYVGEEMHQCLITPFDFKNTYAIVVSGDRFNPCGHMILNVGSTESAGWWFHVIEIRGRPKFMRRAGYERYRKENSKTVLSTRRIEIPNPDGAQRKLDELLSRSWSWFVLPNNCASFLEGVVRAGGSKAGLYLNCPTLERFKWLEESSYRYYFLSCFQLQCYFFFRMTLIMSRPWNTCATPDSRHWSLEWRFAGGEEAQGKSNFLVFSNTLIGFYRISVSA